MTRRLKPGEDVYAYALLKHRDRKPRTRWARVLALVSKIVPFWDGDSQYGVRKK